MKFDLSRMNRLMAALMNPQDCFPSIHIAGTNGKGSVAKMIATVLENAGYKTGLYTSPHLEDIRERFQINGSLIPAAELVRTMGIVARGLHQKNLGFNRLTEFELLTAVAFVWFAHQEIDVAVLEVGLGGRLDATNVVRNVLASVITTIDLDHTQWLGHNRRRIAGEKAGIIKSGRPVVTGATGGALQVIKSRCRATQSPLVSISPSRGRQRFYIHPSLRGPHQIFNAKLAYQTLNLLKDRPFQLSKWGIIQGIQGTRWPGRYEVLNLRTPNGWRTVILDGAHNPAAMRVLIQTLKSENITAVNLLFGVLRDKDHHAMVRMLAPYVRRCVTAPVASSRSMSAHKLAKLKIWSDRTTAASQISEALNNLLNDSSPEPVLVTGSLYLVGEVRSIIGRRT